MRKGDLIVLIPFVGFHRQLVGARLADELHHVSRIEVAFYEFSREVVEQLGIAWRVAGPDVVEWLDDPAAREITPHPIDVTLGEIRVVGRGDPVGEFFAARLVFLRRMFGLEWEGGRTDGAG